MELLPTREMSLSVSGHNPDCFLKSWVILHLKSRNRRKKKGPCGGWFIFIV